MDPGEARAVREQHDDQMHGTTKATDEDATIRIHRQSPSSSPQSLPPALFPSPLPPPAPPPRPPIVPRDRSPAAHPALVGSRGPGARRGRRMQCAVFGVLVIIAVLSGPLLALSD